MAHQMKPVMEPSMQSLISGEVAKSKRNRVGGIGPSLNKVQIPSNKQIAPKGADSTELLRINSPLIPLKGFSTTIRGRFIVIAEIQGDSLVYTMSTKNIENYTPRDGELSGLSGKKRGHPNQQIK